MVHIRTQQKNAGKFKYGQLFTENAIDYSISRNPYSFYLTRGILEDIYEHGFRLVEPETKELKDWNDDAISFIKENWRDIKNAMILERAFGKSFVIAYSNKDKVYIRAFRASDVMFRYNEFAELTYVSIQEKVEGYTSPIRREYSGSKLEYVYELLLREDEYIKARGKSLLEPVWDTLFGLSMLDENAVYFVVRVGGGLKVLKVSDAVWNDTRKREKLIDQVEQWNSGNSVFVLPMPIIGDARNNIDLTLESGNQIDFLAVRDLLVGSLAAATGIPREAWLGNEIGLRSAEVNQENADKIKQKERKNYENFLRWCIWLYQTLNNIIDDQYEFDYYVTEETSETEMLQNLQIKANIVTRLGFDVDMNEWSDLLNLKLEEKEEVELDEFGNPQENKKEEEKKKEEEE